jgi:hypothetical protein
VFILHYINKEEFEEDGSVGYVERIKHIVNAYNLFVGIFKNKRPPPEPRLGKKGAINIAC